MKTTKNLKSYENLYSMVVIDAKGKRYNGLPEATKGLYFTQNGYLSTKYSKQLKKALDEGFEIRFVPVTKEPLKNGQRKK